MKVKFETMLWIDNQEVSVEVHSTLTREGVGGSLSYPVGSYVEVLALINNKPLDLSSEQIEFLELETLKHLP